MGPSSSWAEQEMAAGATRSAELKSGVLCAGTVQPGQGKDSTRKGSLPAADTTLDVVNSALRDKH